MKKTLIIAILAGTCFSACRPDLSTVAPKSGSANFARYLAVGNSLTSGFADGSLYRSGQMNSFPQRLSEQFALVGGGPFKQPLVPGEDGYDANYRKLVLTGITDCQGVAGLAPMPYNGSSWDTTGNATSVAADGPFNNVGVPGIKVTDYLFPGYAAFAAADLGLPGVHPATFAARFFANPGTDRPLDEALRIDPTFFTCWLGSNDVLLYALKGGNPAAGDPIDVISDATAFKNNYDTIVSNLVRNGAKGVLINIPDVTSIPYFNTIPANGLTLTQGAADSLNAFWLSAGNTNIHFSVGANYFVIQDHAGLTRQAVPGELILLTTPQDEIKCDGLGSRNPIPNTLVLTADELGGIQDAIITYNQIIAEAATTYKVGLVDMNAYLKQVAPGIIYDGVKYSASFVTGGTFSLDGIHPSPRGNAIIANQIIRTVNSFYGCTIPLVDINLYHGVLFP